MDLGRGAADPFDPTDLDDVRERVVLPVVCETRFGWAQLRVPEVTVRRRNPPTTRPRSR